MTPDTQDAWSARLTATAAAEINRLRGKRSAQWLADATRDLGHEVTRSVIADMESGRRKILPVADLLVIAAALNVPPMSLLFPPTAETVEVLPGRDVNPWLAHDWVHGADFDPLGNRYAPTDPERELFFLRFAQEWASMNARQALVQLNDKSSAASPELFEARRRAYEAWHEAATQRNDALQAAGGANAFPSMRYDTIYEGDDDQ